MKAKHTPGPWRVHTPTATERRLLVLHPDGERVIARCSEGYNSPISGPIPKEEREANARLIAAAPDLLSALEHALAALDDAMKNHTHWIYADAQQEALQAIAKAEGRTP